MIVNIVINTDLPAAGGREIVCAVRADAAGRIRHMEMPERMVQHQPHNRGIPQTPQFSGKAGSGRASGHGKITATERGGGILHHAGVL